MTNRLAYRINGYTKENKLEDMRYDFKRHIHNLSFSNKLKSNILSKILKRKKDVNTIDFIDLLNEKNVKKRRMNISLFDLLNEKKGIRFQKYREDYRKLIDYKYSKVPISFDNISGIENKDKVEITDVTCYCYNNNGTCPFWRKNYSNGLVYCDAYENTSEVDNSNMAYMKALNYFKTYKELIKRESYVIALFDQVDLCDFKYPKEK